MILPTTTGGVQTEFISCLYFDYLNVSATLFPATDSVSMVQTANEACRFARFVTYSGYSLHIESDQPDQVIGEAAVRL